MKILPRYILKEFLGNLILGLLIFTFVLLLDHLFELVDLLLSKGASLWLTLELLVLLLPSSITLTIPMSCLLAALLTFGRLSESNEVTAVRASGLSPSVFLTAPMAIGALITALLVPFNTLWAPRAHAHFRELYVKMLQANPLVRIEEKVFFEIGDHHVYVEKRDKKSKKLRGVQIYQTPQEGPPVRIFAQEGTASVRQGQGIDLDLTNGTIERIDPSKPTLWNYVRFEKYRLTIPVKTGDQARTRSLEEMDNLELKAQIEQYKKQGLPYPLFSCQRHIRWALAATPFLFIGLGIPLAIRVQRGARSIGFAISLVVIVVYYILLMGGTSLGQRGAWPPWLAVWLANMIVACVSSGLIWRFSTR